MNERRRGAIIFAALVGAILAGCASNPGVPAWYLDATSVYPDDRYLTGVGSADTLDQAQERALAALSQVFQVEIAVDQTTRERYRELMTADGAMSETELELAQTTSLRTAQTLLNVQFGEAAVDDLGRVSVIAVIDRPETGRVYGDLINRNAEQVRAYLVEAQRGDPLRRYAFLSAAGIVAANNEQLVAQLAIIDPARERALDLGYDVETLRTDRADAARAIAVSVAIDGDADGIVAATIREAFTRDGFSTTGSGGTLAARGSLTIRPEELNPEYETVRWTLLVDVVGPDGEAIVAVELNERASGISEDAARAFALRDIEEAVGAEVVGRVRRWFDELVLGS